ncbi:DUF6555 family protein [Pseudomonas huanghezhanensis]|uniref:DUF6555 family protein n=1 Tax=Pseudomonas huanghezhanensis TaxID=3002903 RepID=UPI002285E0CF|nr:DUF6555 family protein [Pseudomonas sp. BSw22131]
MNEYKEFEIHYQFRGETRHFCHQANFLSESEALYFATLHAGVGGLEGNVSARPVRLAIIQAEDLGITKVQCKRT